jgi:tetratricopeptide (TPR) repeat protein
MKTQLAWRGLVAGVCLAICLTGLAAACEGSAAAAMARGDAADAQLKTNESLAAYLEAEKLGCKDATVLRKTARQYTFAMVDAPSKDGQRALGEKGLACALQSISIDPDDAEAQLAVAVCYGRLALLLDNSKMRLSYARQVKEHAEKAISLDSSLDYSYHVLGVWSYEVASLNPILRVLAKLRYGDEVPVASFADAVKNLKKAVELAPQRVSHHIELGRAYAAIGQKSLARTELNKGLALPSREKDDPTTKQRGREALDKL